MVPRARSISPHTVIRHPRGRLARRRTGKRGEDRETARSFADQNKTSRSAAAATALLLSLVATPSPPPPPPPPSSSSRPPRRMLILFLSLSLARTLIRVSTNTTRRIPNRRIEREPRTGTLTTLSSSLSLRRLVVASPLCRRSFFSFPLFGTLSNRTLLLYSPPLSRSSRSRAYALCTSRATRRSGSAFTRSVGDDSVGPSLVVVASRMRKTHRERTFANFIRVEFLLRSCFCLSLFFVRSFSLFLCFLHLRRESHSQKGRTIVFIGT